MNDEAIELLQECREEFIGWAQGDPTGQHWTLAMIKRIDALIAQPKAVQQVWAGECPGCLVEGHRSNRKHMTTCIDYFNEETQGYPNRASQYDDA